MAQLGAVADKLQVIADRAGTGLLSNPPQRVQIVATWRVGTFYRNLHGVDAHVIELQIVQITGDS